VTALVGDTPNAGEAAVLGKNTNTTPNAGFGVHGVSIAGGVVGESKTWHGVAGFSKSTTGGFGVYGKSLGAAVVGESGTWHGVAGFSESTTGGFGVYGKSKGAGVVGESSTWHGTAGFTDSTTGGAAIYGEHRANGNAIVGRSDGGIGVYAISTGHEAVHAETQSLGTAAIAAYNTNAQGTGAAIFAKKTGVLGHAGFFDGNVLVTGTFQADNIKSPNADFAEDFPIAEPLSAQPGMVMVLSDDEKLRPSDAAYDKRVAGVISGAGAYQPGVVLDRQEGQTGRMPVALLGKVYCKVDADYGAIAIGDLLTTSPSSGHAMKVSDPSRALGAIIGKALKALPTGRGMIPILISML